MNETEVGHVFPVEQSDCKVDVELHAVAGAAPDEVHPQGLLVAREPEGPPVVAVAEGIQGSAKRWSPGCVNAAVKAGQKW